MRLRILLSPISLLLLSIANAQTGSIEGYINDANQRLPLPGATVNISPDKTDNADEFGRFYLNDVNPGQYELIVSHIGYRTEIIPVEVKPSLQSKILIQLHRSNLDLSEVRVNARRSSPLSTISAVDVQLRPVNNSQDVLRIVPGLFIAQHAGGGKAEQIFLRGYDIDHGTDINITVDGLPVNMVSHAHGQGYADLHFLIPEMIEKLAFEKGPYFASKGNLATAAYVEFHTKDFLDENVLKAEVGQFNTQRAVALLKLFNKVDGKSRQQFFVGSEFTRTNGYFESPQNFHRFNITGKYSLWLGNQTQLTFIASHFDSKWNASGQIPARAVESGMISQFGAIDDSEGGNTSRTNLSLRFARQWKNNWKTTDQLYFSRYKFNLYSNFTFFLYDPVNGDMINQREARNIIGYSTTAIKSYWLGANRVSTELGAGFRHDDVMDIELSRSNRERFFNSIQKGDIRETNFYVNISQDIELGKKFFINAGLRYDHFIFQYRDELAGAIDFEKQDKGILGPKLNMNYSPSQKVKVYLNNGIGFHSNDSRVILDQSANNILPKVIGTDLGLIVKPGKKLILKTAIWHLYSEQEFVYVGDAGIVEPSGKTRRLGVDLSARYQFNKWLFADLDINFTRARAIAEQKGNDHVPLAPSFTSIGGITAKSKNGISGSIRYRFIGRRPANEDYSIEASGYMLADAVVNYRVKKWEFKISAENIFNIDWREAQFETESRLRNESVPASEIHYTPGIPRFIKAGISYFF